MIDPGHGGNDPGARRGKLVEKEIVFDVARRLEALLDGSRDCEARLSRKDDRRIGLRERHELADAYDADAFVSIHVNAAPAKRALGVEVFFLSMRGASDEASRELASYENEADPGYVFEEDSLLQGIPFSFDLRQSDTLMRSSRLAESILSCLESSHLAASRGVKQAGFGVLKSFQVPSVLVEVGFLSNPQEGKRLASPAHRQDLAESIARGVMAYFDKYAPARLGSNETR
jgi:N-acetylmuramoyl-L-alanine amidase